MNSDTENCLLGKTSTQLGDHKYECGGGARAKPVQQTQPGNMYVHRPTYAHTGSCYVPQMQKKPHIGLVGLGGPGLSPKKDGQLY